MMRFNLSTHIFAIIILVCMMPVGNSMLVSHESEIQDSLICDTIDLLSFNGSLANESVHEQVDMGPRTPGVTAVTPSECTWPTTLEDGI